VQNSIGVAEALLGSLGFDIDFDIKGDKNVSV
jgi:hypothetical protein